LSREEYHNVVVLRRGCELYMSCQHVAFKQSSFDATYPPYILVF
jgi:hypothetical protein